MKNLIETSDLSFSYNNEKNATFKIKGFKLNEGQKVLLEGPSGIGKTTFMFLLSSFYKPKEGIVSYEGKNTQTFSDTELSKYIKQNFGFILPKYSLIPHFTVEENLRMISDKNIIETLKKVGLASKISSKISTLSQGEEQRVGIAKILLGRPKLIFADEPTSNLDDKNTSQVLQLIKDELGDSTLLMVTHDRRTHDFFNERVSFEDMLVR